MGKIKKWLIKALKLEKEIENEQAENLKQLPVLLVQMEQARNHINLLNEKINNLNELIRAKDQLIKQYSERPTQPEQTKEQQTSLGTETIREDLSIPGNKILSAIKDKKYYAPGEIKKLTGLGRTTIWKELKELQEKGLIEQKETNEKKTYRITITQIVGHQDEPTTKTDNWKKRSKLTQKKSL